MLEWPETILNHPPGAISLPYLSTCEGSLHFLSEFLALFSASSVKALIIDLVGVHELFYFVLQLLEGRRSSPIKIRHEGLCGHIVSRKANKMKLLSSSSTESLSRLNWAMKSLRDLVSLCLKVSRYNAGLHCLPLPMNWVRNCLPNSEN